MASQTDHFILWKKKKCHDVVEALMNVTRNKIEMSRKEMEKITMKVIGEMDLLQSLFFLL